MPPLNPGQARVVDPVLSTVARGYRHAMHCWPFLFPVATVMARGGNIITFGTEDFVRRNIRRAPGSNRQRLNVGYSGEKFALEQRALDGQVAIEIAQDAMNAPGINLGRRAANQTMANVSLQIEAEAAGIAVAPGTYPASHRAALAGANQWSHADSQPSNAVNEGKAVVAEGIGMTPNTLIVGYEVWLGLQNNPDVVDRVKHTRGPTANAAQVTQAQMAGYFDVEHFKVADSRHGEPGDFELLWGKNAVLAYVAQSSLAAAEADMGEPSFGYTYRLDGYPVVEEPWFDKSCDSWIYPVTTEDTPVVAGNEAGYLFSAVVA